MGVVFLRTRRRRCRSYFFQPVFGPCVIPLILRTGGKKRVILGGSAAVPKALGDRCTPRGYHGIASVSDDGSHFPGIPKPDHESGREQEHETGNRRAAADPRNGLPVSSSSQKPARNPGPDVSRPEKSHLCSRLFLASARLPERSSTCVEYAILEQEARWKHPQRQKESGGTETERMVRSRAMGV